ncbi:acetate uptake transporter family protein [Salinisphaera sp. LB1]|uniref:acetate uptake transporter n=1 Tax=Salinisphaera sp. LB1 TaxID=2183911 RepID=UPI000D706770|nr:GPR1/FUN34/YaaH family transporter [Salinisphaera sp. LB1]AWN16895.1 YaaH protein [Salinisphaera sp. LB1]
MSTAPTRQTADPAPLGLFATALPAWLLGMINAGWYPPDNIGLLIAVVFAFGGGAQVIAGCLEFVGGNTLGFTGFTAFGAFWWSLALYLLFFHKGVAPAFAGWYFLLFGTVSLALWLGALKESRALQFFFLNITVSFVLAAFGHWFDSEICIVLGGYATLMLAVVSIYLAFAAIVNGANDRIVLPVGAAQSPPTGGL